MIRKITLTNYMSHAHTVIEPAEGLTVLTGPNNCGKSAVVSALETLCNNAGGGYMVRHGTKEAGEETSVEVETAEGDVLVWKRVKGVVSYVINGRDVHRLGRGVPDDLHKLLRLGPVDPGEGNDPFDIHFADQKSPIFLLNEPESRAAVFFAASSDASRLLEIQKRHRLKVRDRKQEEKRLAREVEALEREIAAFEPLDELAPHLKAVETEHRELARAGEAAGRLSGAMERIGEGDRRCARLERRGKVLGALCDPPELEDAPALEKAIADLRREDRRRARNESALRALRALSDPPPQEDWAALEGMIARLGEAERAGEFFRLRAQACHDLQSVPPPLDTAPLEDCLRRLRETAVAARKLSDKIDGIQSDIGAAEQELRDWAQANPTCPTCGAPIDAERLIRGGHAHG